MNKTEYQKQLCARLQSLQILNTFLFQEDNKKWFSFNSNCYILTFLCAAQIETRNRTFLEKRMQIHNKNNDTCRFDIRVVGIYLFVTVRPSSKFHTLSYTKLPSVLEYRPRDSWTCFIVPFRF